MGAGGDQDPHQHVVVGIADVVPLRLFADLERAHVEACRHVSRAEHKSLHAWACRDRVDVGHPLRVLDLRLDADPAHRKAVRALQLAEQQVERGDMRDVGHLRKHDDVERRARGGYHFDGVGVGPRRRPVVDPHPAQLACPARIRERRRDLRSGLGLGLGCDGIFQVEKHLVRGQRLRLLDHFGAAAGNRKDRSAGSIPVFHNHTLYPLSHGGGEQGLCGPTRGNGGVGPRR
jgi:hypothetical protein